MKNTMLILSTGLAMFSMFFGSGNLVFPLLVGQMSQGHFILGSFGIFLTGVVVPFLGILAVLLFSGDSRPSSSKLGRCILFGASLAALSLMGPFGVLARCIAVAHGAFRLLSPETPLWLFSLLSCATLLVLTLRKNRIVTLLGSVLTPLLLVALGLIAVFSLFGNDLPTAQATEAWSSFKLGILQGYQTMDLLAAFFFSSFVIKHLKEREPDPAASLPIFWKSSLIGAGLLASIYCVLVLLGSIHAEALANVPPQEMLGAVASLSLGPMAAPIVATAAILACLTTAIVLTSLFADFFKKEVCKEKIPMSLSIGITLSIAFCISTLDFQGIMNFLAPILGKTYPTLITLTVGGILYRVWELKFGRLRGFSRN
jgi:LIVCS family branched-chain amino acid:cation transporter